MLPLVTRLRRAPSDPALGRARPRGRVPPALGRGTGRRIDVVSNGHAAASKDENPLARQPRHPLRQAISQHQPTNNTPTPRWVHSKPSRRGQCKSSSRSGFRFTCRSRNRDLRPTTYSLRTSTMSQAPMLLPGGAGALVRRTRAPELGTCRDNAAVGSPGLCCSMSERGRISANEWTSGGSGAE